MPTPEPLRVPLPEGLPMLDPERFRPERRRALSGPALRTFLNIAEEWRLSEAERLRVLGLPSRSTFHGWVAKARKGAAITLSVDELIRLSLVLGIYKALKIVFARPEDAERWLRAPNSGPAFGGHAPLQLITSGTQDALTMVRWHLDAWRGGVFATPVPGFDDVIPPITDSDLVFV